MISALVSVYMVTKNGHAGQVGEPAWREEGEGVSQETGGLITGLQDESVPHGVSDVDGGQRGLATAHDHQVEITHRTGAASASACSAPAQHVAALAPVVSDPQHGAAAASAAGPSLPKVCESSLTV